MVKTHVRRTPEQKIADLEAEIERVKQREAAKELKADPCVQEAIKLARAIGKAEAIAKTAKDDALAGAVSAAHEAIGGYLESKGIAVPKRRTRARKAG